MRKIFLSVMVICISAVLIMSCSNKGPQGPVGKEGPACATLQNNSAYNGTRDTYIDSLGNTYGADNNMIVGVLNDGGIVERALIRFDLTSIVPSDVSIDSAYLTLYPYSSAFAGTTTITAYALAGDTSGLWSENSVTWDSWNTAGGVFSQTPMSDTVVLSDPNVTGVTFKLNAAVVQGWFSDPASNNGLILKASNETIGYNYFGFLTKENGSISGNPLLTVYYRLP
jgi:hypothetical protein